MNTDIISKLKEIEDLLEQRKGGPGSGHFGHGGRPGKRGGSAAGSGKGARGRGSAKDGVGGGGGAKDDGKSVPKPVKSSGSKAEDAVLDFFASDLDEVNFHSVADSVSSDISTVLWDEVQNPAEHEKLSKRGGKAWEQAFKKRYGISSSEYSNRVVAQEIAGMSDAQRKTSKLVGDYLITGELSPTEFKNQGVRYKPVNRKNKKGLYLGSSQMYEEFMSDAEIKKETGLSRDEFISEIEGMGAYKIKPTRRKKRSSSSYYD